jgi:hypothetical protein
VQYPAVKNVAQLLKNVTSPLFVSNIFILVFLKHNDMPIKQSMGSSHLWPQVLPRSSSPSSDNRFLSPSQPGDLIYMSCIVHTDTTPHLHDHGRATHRSAPRQPLEKRRKETVCSSTVAKAPREPSSGASPCTTSTKIPTPVPSLDFYFIRATASSPQHKALFPQANLAKGD